MAKGKSQKGIYINILSSIDQIGGNVLNVLGTSALYFFKNNI